MIQIMGRIFFHVVRTLMPGPAKANRPILILVEDTPNDFPLDGAKVRAG